jgi:diguanylate cyclase (GGDEF)-like protein/PAS domain S-box-containing protein
MDIAPAPDRIADDPDLPTPQAMLDMLPGLVAFFGHDLRYRYANGCYMRWRGVDPEWIIGRHCSELVGAANYPLIRDRLREALSGTPVTYEYDLFEDGHARRVQGSYIPHRAADGRVLGVIALVTALSDRDDLRQRVEASEAIFDQAFCNSPIGMAVVEPSGRILRVNASFAAMLGRDVETLSGLHFRVVTHPDDLDADLDLFRETLAGLRDGYQLDKRYIRADGAVMYARLTITTAHDGTGSVSRMVAQIEDVTERRDAEQRLRRGAARLHLAMDAIPGGFWHMDVQTGVFETSGQLARFATGHDTPLDLAGYCTLIEAEDLPRADLSPLLDGRVDCASAEYRLHTPRGVRWTRCDRRLVRDSRGRPEQVVGVVLDVTEERLRERAFETEAETDTLTALLNRRGFERRVLQSCDGRQGGLLAIDLDRFKQVNDGHGHAVGDQVLVAVADRLRRAVRATDLVCRLGGDEFLIAMPGASRATLGAAAERVSDALKAPLRLPHAIVPLGGSVGAVWSAALTENLPALLACADRALYEVKAAGRGHWLLAG